MTAASSPPARRRGSRTTAPVLRLRGDPALEDMLAPGEGGEAARLKLPVREPVQQGDRLRIEISFGPLTDEIEIEGEIAGVLPEKDGGSPTMVITFGRDQAPRIRYLRHVLGGRRTASARRHRRIPVDLEVRWRAGGSRYASRASDLSRGGAFIVSRYVPRIGDTVEVELVVEGQGMLQFEGVVTWVREDGQSPGFGVNFRLSDRSAAAALHDIVRRQERRP